MLAVAGSAYDSAAEAWAAGGIRAGEALDHLATGLQSAAGMGGDDASSEDFVAAYDDGARETFAALGDLAEAFGSIAALTDASAARHLSADARAAAHTVADPGWVGLGFGGRGVVVAEHGPPPSALGGDGTAAPPMWDLIVDHLEGWAWPSADVDRLRDASDLWRHTGSRVRDLAGSLAVGESALGDQRSPEVPLALGASAELRGHTESLAEQCDDLAQACADYADRVESTRQVVTDLLTELAVELAATVVMSGALSLVTFGGAAVVGAGTATLRAVTCARRVIAVLRTLKTYRAISVAARTYPKARNIRTALQKFRNIEHVSHVAPAARSHPWLVTRRWAAEADPSEANLLSHVKVHADQFPGLTSRESYDAAARQFLSDPPAGTRTIVRSDGSVIRWHERSEWFAIMDGSGAPASLFKLDRTTPEENMTYFLKQMLR